MPRFLIEDTKSELKFTVEGDRPPTQEEAGLLLERYKEQRLAGPQKFRREPVFTEEQIGQTATRALETGVPPEDVQNFISQQMQVREKYVRPAPPEAIPAFEPVRPVTDENLERARQQRIALLPGMVQQIAALPDEERAARETAMREAAQQAAMERMIPGVLQATGVPRPFSGRATSQEAEELARRAAELRREELGIPEWMSRAAAAGGQPADVALQVGLPLAATVGTGMVTANPAAAAKAGALSSAAADYLVQQRRIMRGEQEKYLPGQTLVETAMGAFVPPTLKAERGLSEFRKTLPVSPGAAALERTPLGLSVVEAAMERGGQMTLAGMAGEAVRQQLDEKYVNPQQILTVGVLSGMFGAGFGSLERSAPVLWNKIKGLTPDEALPVIRSEPLTPQTEAAMKEMEDLVARRLAEPSPVAPQEAIERAVGLRPTTKEGPQGYSPAAPSVEGMIPPSQRDVLRLEARAALATQAFEELPPLRKAEEAARVFEEEAAKQERATAFAAKELTDQLDQTRLAAEESIPLTEAQRLAKMEGRAQELEKEALQQRARELKARPGEAKKEQAAISERLAKISEEEGQVEAAFKAGEKAPPVSGSDIAAVTPPAEALPELSPQAQRMLDRFGGADRQLLLGLAGGGAGFVAGWEAGEGLPPEDRLLYAIKFGAAGGTIGALTPTALRRLIRMQGWADSVIKERGVSNGALNTADPQILAALAVKGAAVAGEGVKSFAEWSAKMVSRYGESIRSNLNEIWAAAQESDIIPTKVVKGAPDRPPRQYETPAFKTWFGKSKVVNEDGTPKVMYHGASDVRGENARMGKTDFTTFKPNRQGLIFVTPDGGFAGVMAGSKNERARVYPLYVRAENIFDYSNPEHIKKIFGDKDTVEATARSVSRKPITTTIYKRNVEDGDWYDIEFIANNIRKAGFDGFYVSEAGYKNLAVFDPIQLKSATGNRGTYSLRDRDIRGISTPAAMMPVAGAGVGAVAGAAMGETPEEKLKYAALGMAAGAGAGAVIGRGAKAVAGKGISAEPRTGAVTVSKGTPQSPTQSYETPNFKAWFKNSQVVNEDGTPRRMYHGTTKNNLTKFDQRSGGIWVAFDPENASPGTGDAATSVIPLLVSAQKIYTLTPEELKNWRMSRQPKRLAMDILNRERANGYDALQIGNYALVVAKPTQVKSAVSNSGAYSNINPRIAGYVSKELMLPLGSFAGGFAYGWIEGSDRTPDQRLLSALTWAGLAGGGAYALSRKAANGVKQATATPPPAKLGLPNAPSGTSVLQQVDEVFKYTPTEKSEAQKKLSSPWNRFIEIAQNRFTALTDSEHLLLGKGDAVPLGDSASLLAGSTAKAEAGVYELGQQRNALGPEVTNEDINRFLFLRRTHDRLTKGSDRQVGDWTLDKVRIGLRELADNLGVEKMEAMEKFGQYVQQSTDKDLRLLVDSGRMSEDTYRRVKEMNEFYAPFLVMDYYSQIDGSLPMIGGSLDTSKAAVEAIKGVKEENLKLGDMMSALAMNKIKAQVLADKNRFMLRVASVARRDSDNLFYKDLGPTKGAKYESVPKGWDTVNYIENGVDKKIAVAPEIARAVKGMDEIRADIFLNYMDNVASVFRAGATGLNLGFQVVNVFKDTARFGIMSKYGLSSPLDLYQFPLDMAAAFVSAFKGNVAGVKDELYLEFLRSGAARSTIASNLTPDALTRLAMQRDQTAAAKMLGVPYRLFVDTPAKLGNVLEEAIKLTGFKRGKRMENLGSLSGKAYDDALERIAYEVRNYAGSPDFSKRGTHGKYLNALFMFANARMQGTAADLRRLSGGTGKREAAYAAVKLFSGVGSATLYVWSLNNQPENIRDYQSRPLTERNNYFLFPQYNADGSPMYYLNEDGQRVRSFLRFPKAEIIGQVANLMESALNYVKSKDPQAIVNFAGTVLESVSPIPISGRNLKERAESMASGLNPVIKAPMEAFLNRNLFYHRDIVPERLQYASPEMQFKTTTPEMYRTMAKAMPSMAPDILRSPLQLEQLTRNFTGGLITQFMRPEQEGRSSLVANPVLGRFFSAPYEENQADWDIVNRLRTEQADRNAIRYNAIQSFLKEENNMDPRRKMAALAQILSADPENNAKVLTQALMDQRRGTTPLDRAVRNLDSSGTAQFIYEKRNQLPTVEQRDGYIREMLRKGIITEDVAEKLIPLMKAAPPPPKSGKKTSFIEGRLYKDPDTGVFKLYRNGQFV